MSLRVYDFEVILKFGMLKFLWNAGNEPASDILNIASHCLHREARKLALSFLRRLAAELDIVLNTVLVAMIT